MCCISYEMCNLVNFHKNYLFSYEKRAYNTLHLAILSLYKKGKKRQKTAKNVIFIIVARVIFPLPTQTWTQFFYFRAERILNPSAHLRNSNMLAKMGHPNEQVFSVIM